jgi:hypothetical protein
MQAYRSSILGRFRKTNALPDRPRDECRHAGAILGAQALADRAGAGAEGGVAGDSAECGGQRVGAELLERGGGDAGAKAGHAAGPEVLVANEGRDHAGRAGRRRWCRRPLTWARLWRFSPLGRCLAPQRR